MKKMLVANREEISILAKQAEIGAIHLACDFRRKMLNLQNAMKKNA